MFQIACVTGAITGAKGSVSKHPTGVMEAFGVTLMANQSVPEQFQARAPLGGEVVLLVYLMMEALMHQTIRKS